MKENSAAQAVRPDGGVPMVRPETRRRVTPAVDVYETADSYVLMVDLPGAPKEAINLTLEAGTLTVRAEPEPYHTPEARLIFRELATPVYERSFTIGDGVDQAAVDARFEDGVLTVKLFKKEERKPREIAIR